MKRKERHNIEKPDRILSYFGHEKLVLLVVTISGIVYNVGLVASPYFEGQLAQCLYDIINGLKKPDAMVLLVLAYVATIIAVQLLRAVKRFYVRIFANNISRDMRHILYNSLVNMDQRKLENENLGALMTKAIADVGVCSEGMRKFTTEIFDTGVVMTAYLVMLAVLDWRLALLSLLFTPLAFVISANLKKKVSSANSAYKESASALNQMTMDRVSNSLTYRLFGREDNRNAAYEKKLADYEKKSAWAHFFEGSLTPIYDAIAMMGTVMILFFGARNVIGRGWTEWDIASFTTFMSCFAKLARKASHSAKLFNSVQKAKVSWRRIKPLMKPVTKAVGPNGQVESVDISFSDVECGYNDNAKLSGVSFCAKPGEIVGVTGVVASGKSMLGKVLLDLVPWKGRILLGNKDFSGLTESEKHSYISYMGHEPELLSISVSENVCLGDDVDVDMWLKAVCLDEEVSLMEKGPDTMVGSAGIQLSGGQQSRLALARTLAHARSVVILDDPLSSVDKETETRILKNIRAMMKDRIVILISHRLYHFPELDHVLFIHDGKAEYSDHNSLMASQPQYAELYGKQTGGGDLDE